MAGSVSALARHRPVRLQDVLPVMAAERATLVRMNDDFLARLASLHRHQQRIRGQLAGHPLTHRQTDDPAGEQIEHGTGITSPHAYACR